jgi:hypothetical protein
MSRSALLLSLVMAAAVVTGASAFQQTRPIQPSNEPGHPAPPNVWIMNRGSQEAIPVTFAMEEGVRTHSMAQPWQYTSISVPVDRDLSSALAPVGRDGWEAVGVIAFTADHAVVLFKRPAR